MSKRIVECSKCKSTDVAILTKGEYAYEEPYKVLIDDLAKGSELRLTCDVNYYTHYLAICLGCKHIVEWRI